MVVVTIMVIMSERRADLSLFQNLFHNSYLPLLPPHPAPLLHALAPPPPEALQLRSRGMG